MLSQAVRVWCLGAALLLGGCEVHVAVDSEPAPRPQLVTVVKQNDGYYELKAGETVSKIVVIHAGSGESQSQTISYTYDAEDNAYYAARTVHDCDEKTSTIKYFAIYDEHNALIEAHDVDVDVDLDPGSLGEAEFELACKDQLAKDPNNV